VLEIKSIHLERNFRRGADFDAAFSATLRDLATFLGADAIALPRGWRKLLG
jgi:hypothetical protein